MAKEVSNGSNHVTTKPPPEPSPLRRAKFFKANMRILVTGGAGFIGSHLVDKLMENEKNEVIVVDNYFTGSKDNLRQWIGHPRFELIRHGGILLTSTSEVYGDPLVHPQTEDYWGNVNPIGVRSCYDEGKRVAETLMFDYHRQHGIEIRIARIFNTYGPRMNIDDGRVVSNFLAQAIRDEALTVQLPGTQTRSFCYVSDMVDGLIRLMEGDNTGPINIGNPDDQSRSGDHDGGEHPDDPRQRKPDITKAKELLGWEPKIKLRDGIPLMEEDFRKRLGILRKN
ncbi:UNVERIFIED_CONTAM: UDP-glucuronic acid decarboxylase 6 [Sesamum radiatum]|uniref:UDP-glucuronic acid decarboxylase 6 n=1 Tax=Sesamum radiatum TaxID=300843 RepID=A0AAW2MZB1_SESRA